MKTVVKTTQEQAVAAWIDYLNQLRLDELISKLNTQDINLESALKELQNIKEFISDPSHILGSDKSKHGEIAEHMQVGIANARKLIEGLTAEYSFDSIGRTAPADYLKNGQEVQAKFYVGTTGKRTFDAIKEHLEKYPNFLKDGGSYEIPKDQHEKICDILSKPSSQLSRSEQTLVKIIREWEKTTGTNFLDKVKPTVINYADAQIGNADEVVGKEEDSIKEKDKEKRDSAHEASKPSWKEAGKATAISAGIEGGVSFCLAVSKKLKSGKKLNEFTAEDWKEVGIDTGKGGIKGAVRGGAVYGMTNFSATPAAVASSFVTATFGVSSLAYQLHKGKITNEEFVENSQVVCLDVTISAVSSILGQVAIPIPILGAIIGNAAGVLMYGIAKNSLSKKEQDLIQQFNDNIGLLNMKLDKRYLELVEQLKDEFAKFTSVVDLAFDLNVNIAFAGSIDLARYVGVSEEKILHNKNKIDSYFEN